MPHSPTSMWPDLPAGPSTAPPKCGERPEERRPRPGVPSPPIRQGTDRRRVGPDRVPCDRKDVCAGPPTRRGVPMRNLSAALFLLLAAGPAAGEPARIVSVGGAITECVVALGLQERLIAVDTTSLYPAEVQKLPNVGYMRALSAEPILALNPDLVLLHADAGPEAVVRQLRESGLPIVRLPKATDIGGAARVIRRVGHAVGRATAGRTLADTMEAEAGRIAAAAGAMPVKPRVLFLLSIGKGAPLASGTGTAAAGIIRAAGGVNAVDGYEGYKPLSPEAAVAADPDLILATERTVELMGGRDAILDRAEIRPTTAGAERRLVIVDGLLMLGFGPRTAAAVTELSNALHPHLDAPDRN